MFTLVLEKGQVFCAGLDRIGDAVAELINFLVDQWRTRRLILENGFSARTTATYEGNFMRLAAAF